MYLQKLSIGNLRPGHQVRHCTTGGLGDRDYHFLPFHQLHQMYSHYNTSCMVPLGYILLYIIVCHVYMLVILAYRLVMINYNCISIIVVFHLLVLHWQWGFFLKEVLFNELWWGTFTNKFLHCWTAFHICIFFCPLS